MVWASHRGLRDVSQVPRMVEAIRNGELLPLVLLFESADGMIQILDGHHRCCAYWLAGQDHLDRGDYVLLAAGENLRPRAEKIPRMAAWLFPEWRRCSDA